MLQEQQSVLAHSHNCSKIVEIVGSSESADKIGFLLILHMS